MGVERAVSVTADYGQGHREIQKDAIGFGSNDSAIYFDCQDGVVDHIWLINPFDFDREKLTDLLLRIGQKWNLLLNDWNQALPVDLTIQADIENYLTQ